MTTKAEVEQKIAQFHAVARPGEQMSLVLGAFVEVVKAAMAYIEERVPHVPE